MVKPTNVLLADALSRMKFGYPFEDWLNDQRDKGRSWERIASEFVEEFDLERPIYWKTIQRWATNTFGIPSEREAA
jgi:hypothetical protein